VGLGSDFYAGSAGSMGQALFEGYLGIEKTGDELSIEPRLGMESVRVHIHYPVNGRFLSYDYRFDEESDKITLSIESDFPQNGTLKILNPWASPVAAQSPSHQLVVLLDGKEVGFGRESKNQDEYIVIKPDLSKGKIEIFLKLPI